MDFYNSIELLIKAISVLVDILRLFLDISRKSKK